ncbi:hypothetical protein [Glycomyces arizonensis]|uniref:hypothetical protein n=1 Tax=Glycomyces arizonensis TaxID=256035 RepID=UPI00041D642C|nr:hypothetical protein [Glycomyces arizonensis]
MNLHEHETEFERAAADPANLRVDLPPIDVNAVLAAHYDLDEPLEFTRTMLWDMELRKARRPDLYLPGGVAPGSARTWTTPALEATGDDVFVRVSEQRNLEDPTDSGPVIEQVGIDHEARTVTFIGTAEHVGPDGGVLRAAEGRSLFHVEHGAGGTESRPLNTMRWVFLAPEDRDGTEARLRGIIGQPARLPEFIEIYIRDVLGVGLRRRAA